MKLLLLLIKSTAGVMSRLRNVGYKILGVRTTGYVWMRRISIPRQWGDILIEKGVALDDGVVLLCSGPPKVGKIVIGSCTYINRFTFIDANESISIGRNCMIGPGCYITDGDHRREPGRLVLDQGMIVKKVLIGDNVWLGAGVKILKGVSIGSDAVVGAGAVVTKDVGAGTRVAGVPARVIVPTNQPNA